MIKGTIEKQIELEKEYEGKKLEKYLREINEAIVHGRLDETPEGKMLVKLGYEPLKVKIEEYFETPSRGQLQKDKKFLQLLCDDVSVLSFITLRTIISLTAKSGVISVAKLSKAITKSLKDIYLFDRLKKDNPKLHAYLGTEYKRASRKRKAFLINKHINHMYTIDFEGNENALAVRIGSTLIDLFDKSGANIIKIYRDKATMFNTKRAYLVKLTDEAQDILVEYPNINKILAKANMLPMIVEPKDWTSNTTGGYLVHKIRFVKHSNNLHTKFIDKQDLSKVYPIINKLQKTSWRVNKRVLDVMYDIYTNNMIDPKSSPTLPRCYGGLPSPNNYNAIDLIGEQPKASGLMEGKNDEKNLRDEWHKWNKLRERTQIDLDAEVSRRFNFTFALEVAHKMIDYEKFYYVYQTDYRGRVYTHNEFLKPQAKSYVKAMLEFGEGRKLNKEGEFWLKVHIANCYGLDKEPFENRIKFVDENIDLILKITEDPIMYLSEWIYTDSPYEYLASCYAMKDFLEDKEVYLPIQLDATCSGLQFYSGLLLDKEGALSVNVIGKDRQDIYQKVADKVNLKLINGDFPKVLEYKDSTGEIKSKFTHKEANSITNKISRSVCKSNTMTVPYSVTIRGMSEQNHSYMHKCILEGKVFWEGDRWVVNKLITDLNYRSIYEVVKGAKEGQEYLKEVVANIEEVPIWYTPIYDFPVLQPTYKKKRIHIRTPIARLELIQNVPGVDKYRQASSIAANFIHSMDSTLLMYCIDNMSSDVGVIHDCFLVHPNDGEEIRNHYKEGFIIIMLADPLRQFGKQLDPEGKIEVPCIGTLNLEEVRDSMYILS